MRRLLRASTPAIALAALLALAGCVVLPPAAPAAPDEVAAASPWPRNMASHGFVATVDGVLQTPEAEAEAAPTATADIGDAVHVIVYVDPLCPFCGEFVTANALTLMDAVAAGDVALETHPVAFLDRLSMGTDYSTRAANAIAAVADEFPDVAPIYAAALFEYQPAENTAGLDDAELLEIASSFGAESATLTTNVEQQTFREFVTAATQAAQTSPLPGLDEVLTGTPTVIVDGERYTGEPNDAAAFEAMLAAAIAG